MVFQESDFICKEGTQADEMFFLVKGKCFTIFPVLYIVSMYQKLTLLLFLSICIWILGKAGIYYGSKLIVVIEEGSYFGEIGCIMGGIRRAGVKALSTCELQALSRRNLNILLGE